MSRKRIRSMWRRGGKPGESLRAFARRIAREGDRQEQAIAEDWLINKGIRPEQPYRAGRAA